jgi:hypothetical protein
MCKIKEQRKMLKEKVNKDRVGKRSKFGQWRSNVVEALLKIRVNISEMWYVGQDIVLFCLAGKFK